MKKYSLIGVALALATVLGVLVLLRGGTPERRQAQPAGADFILQSADGPVDSKSLRGKVLLLYFGYTNCPDICPAALASGGQVLKMLSNEERSRVKLILVSVDPERDSVAHLKEYTAFFHPDMLGLTGTPAEVAALAKAFGAGYAREPARPDGSYAVDHTTSTYVVAPNGQLSTVLDLGASADKVAAAVRKIL